MVVRDYIKEIQKQMDVLIARSNAGFNIYDQVFKIEELLENIEKNHCAECENKN